MRLTLLVLAARSLLGLHLGGKGTHYMLAKAKSDVRFGADGRLESFRVIGSYAHNHSNTAWKRLQRTFLF